VRSLALQSGEKGSHWAQGLEQPEVLQQRQQGQQVKIGPETKLDFIGNPLTVTLDSSGGSRDQRNQTEA
jgi:hypothetical protein